jgi:hypothetical protein
MTAIRAAATATLLVVASSASAAVDCPTYMVGDWAGRGKVEFMGATEVESAFSYRADGSYASVTKFVQQDGAWSDPRKAEGRWSAGPGEQPNACAVNTTQQGEGFQSDFTIDVEVIDAGSHRIMGLVVTRR